MYMCTYKYIYIYIYICIHTHTFTAYTNKIEIAIHIYIYMYIWAQAYFGTLFFKSPQNSMEKKAEGDPDHICIGYTINMIRNEYKQAR